MCKKINCNSIKKRKVFVNAHVTILDTFHGTITHYNAYILMAVFVRENNNDNLPWLQEFYLSCS